MCGALPDAWLSAMTLVGLEGLRQCFFQREPGLTCGEKREDDDAVVGHEEGDEEGFAETDDAHSRVMQ